MKAFAACNDYSSRFEVLKLPFCQAKEDGTLARRGLDDTKAALIFDFLKIRKVQMFRTIPTQKKTTGKIVVRL